jgi:hypothetical protein
MERTESYQPVDRFGLLHKETKVTKTHSRSRYTLRSLGYLLFKSLNLSSVCYQKSFLCCLRCLL